MRNDSSLPTGNFREAFDQLVPPKLLNTIASDVQSTRRRPPKLKIQALLREMVFHSLQGSGTLAENVKTATGKKISNAAISQRRSAMGFEPFHWLLRAALSPKANPKKHPEAFYKGKRLVALDGSKFSVSNTPQVAGAMFKPVSRRFKAAFAKVNVCVLVELGLRNPLAASIGIKNESETVLAAQLLEQTPAGTLTLGDRHYGVRPVIDRYFEQEREFLFRIKANFKRRLLERYPDGSALVEIQTPSGKRLVREIIGKLRRPKGKWVEVRLWTNLLDWQAYPASELLELYGRRWEEEIVYKELKIDMRSRELLQSHTPETAAQEVAALILAHAILVDQRIEAARLGKVEVLRISFRKTLTMLQPLWLVLSCSKGILSSDQVQQMVGRVMREIGEAAIPKRRKRSCPRAVRQPVSSWPRLIKNTYQKGPTDYKLKRITR